MTKEAFFSDPIAELAKGPVDSAWIREAWASDAAGFRTRVTEELARSVSKHAAMAGHKNWTSLLSNALSLEQIVALYVDIREMSQRLEFEWRPGFAHIFQRAGAALPPPDAEKTRLYYCSVLFTAISSNDLEALKELLPEMKSHGLTLEDMTLTEEELSRIGIALTTHERKPQATPRTVTALGFAKHLGCLGELARIDGAE